MSKGKILVTGGCGYIGSHTIVDLIENGYDVSCVDNLSNSTEAALVGIKTITGANIINHSIDLADRAKTLAFFAQHQFDGVIHFAALKLVGESVEQPLEYVRNNVNSLLNVIEGQALAGNSNVVFSSSCSVYGNADELPVTETTPRKEAESPYARTKQMGEDILYDYCKPNPDFKAVILRYFNPAGAHESGALGESPSAPPSNLVPVITEVAIGKRPEMTVFGDDYDTRDGSCIRDYIHIMDLAHAHTLAVEHLLSGQQTENPALFNLGIGEGLTVLEVIRAFEKTTEQKLNYKIGPRRAGDVVAVYADKAKASKVLGWEPSRGVESIMASAWAWEQNRSRE
ncbi:MAG: UDP-glucose 4-epimerase GalE [Bacteroidota bacterium]